MADVCAARLQLEDQVKQVQQEMRRLKVKYDSLLEQSTLREKNIRGESLKQAVTGMSKGQDRRSVSQIPSHGPSASYPTTPINPCICFLRAPEATVQKEQTSVQSTVGTLR